MNWIKRIFNRSKPIEWKTENSIYQYIADNLDAQGCLKDSVHRLPDEPQDDNENAIKFAPGLIDTLFGAQDTDDSKVRIKQLNRLIERIAKHGDDVSQLEFYENITANTDAIGIIDAFLQEMIANQLPINPYFFEFAKGLAFQTRHRNSVKFGLALLGLCQNQLIVDKIKILGLHDEFTVFATVALTNILEHPTEHLWQLARQVDGWGKIQLVDRLVQMELSEAQEEWLVLEGYKNSIMYEYLAYTCAVKGELHKRLAAPTISNKFFISAGEILSALIMGGPAEDMVDYEHAATTTKHYIHHAQKLTSTIADFLVLKQIQEFLVQIKSDIGNHGKNGWSHEIIDQGLDDIEPLINDSGWEELTRHALRSTDHLVYWNGKQAAKKLNMDIWDVLWQKLLDNPLDFSYWFDVTHDSKPQQADQIIDFGITAFPLKELATGPKDSLGLGENYSRYHAFDSLVTFLENHPSKGESIILAALNSPVTSNRNSAINSLSKWTKAHWSKSIQNQLEELKNIEPNEKTKNNIERLLNGQELSWS